MRTELVIILDCSLSMQDRWSQAVDAVNKLIAEHRECLVTLISFSGESYVHFDQTTILATASGIAVRSTGTALLDSVSDAIAHVERRAGDGRKVIIVTLTDGEENASRHTTLADLAARIEAKEKAGWNFIYMISCDSGWTREKGSEMATALGYSTLLNTDAAGYANAVAEISRNITAIRSGAGGEWYSTKLTNSWTKKMQVGKFSARLMRAPKLESNDPCKLPPGSPIPVFPVELLPGCPENWVKEPGSYVCPIEPGWAFWFGFTENDEMNTAVLPSVKGMNPITGQKLSKVELEQYAGGKCPVHNLALASTGLCDKCGFKWPPKNYLSHPDKLWIDGWIQPDGTVRQFTFTEDEAKDIASLVIGKQSTVPAFGFAFFEPVKARVRATVGLQGLHGISGHPGMQGAAGPYGFPSSYPRFPSAYPYAVSMPLSDPNPSPDYAMLDGEELSSNYCSTGDLQAGMQCMAEPEREEKTCGGILRSAPLRVSLDAKKSLRMSNNFLSMPDHVRDVSVGAGAKIEQEVKSDELSVADWKPEATGLIRLYFVFRPQFEQILERGGVRNLQGQPEGFLKGLPVG